MLSVENFARAQQFIRENARLLDVRLFEYEFAGGTAVSVLDTLTNYQNEDGGFGHGIEPDFRLVTSSPMATSVGLQYCVAVDASAEHPIVQKAVQYLLETYDREHEYWPFFVDTAVNDYPHAPWWHTEEIVPPNEDRWPNVSAELVGYIHHYRELVSPEFHERVIKRARQNLASTDILSSYYHGLCWERTAKLVDDPFYSQIKAKVQKTFEGMRPVSEETLKELPVFAVAASPDSFFTQTLPQETAVLLKNSISMQAEDGGWWPKWRWGQYEEIWPIAQREWAGKLTLEALEAYKAFNLIP